MSNTNNIIIIEEEDIFPGSGTGDITGPVPSPEETPNLVDLDTLNLLPLSTSTPEEGDILVYNGSLYVPTSLVLSMNKDVDLTGLSDTNILSYDSSQGKWVPTDIDSVLDNNIQFDSISEPLSTDLLSYNGASWVPISRDSLLNSMSLTNLNNVQIDTSLNGQLLRYNSSNSTWENKTLVLTDIGDISTDIPEDSELLVYNSSSGKWEPTSLSLSLLSDFSTNPAGENDVLMYDTSTSKWEPTSLVDLSNTLAPQIDILELKDVRVLNALDKQFLTWDSALQKWINYTPSLVDLSDYNSSNNPQEGNILLWDSTSSTWKTSELTPELVLGFDPSEVGSNKTLVYNSVTSSWEPKLITLGDLVDRGIDVTTLEDNTSIYWDSISSSWVYKNRSFEDIVDIPGISDKEILSYNSALSKWEAVGIETLVQLSQNLEDLNDTDLSNISNKDMLVYNSTSSKWENRELFLSDIKNVDLTNLSNKGYLRYNTVTSKWEVTFLTLENLVSEGVDKSTIENDSSLYWNSSTESWDFKNKTTEELLGFSNTPNNSLIVYDTATNKWKTDLIDNLLSFSNDLESLLDIDVVDLSQDDILVYNSISSKWENKEINLEFIKDIDISGLADGNTLRWNSSLSRWEPMNISSLITSVIGTSSIEELSDLSVSLKNDKDILIYNTSSSSWENGKLEANSLKGISLAGQTTSQYLTWNSSLSRWEFKSYTFEDLTGVSENTLVDTNLLIWESGSWRPILAFELSDFVAPEMDLGELKNVNTPNKSNNQVLTWDSATQKWQAKNLDNLGVVMNSTMNILGNDWVSLFNSTLNY
jgi:hypothetical protein